MTVTKNTTIALIPVPGQTEWRGTVDEFWQRLDGAFPGIFRWGHINDLMKKLEKQHGHADFAGVSIIVASEQN